MHHLTRQLRKSVCNALSGIASITRLAPSTCPNLDSSEVKAAHQSVAPISLTVIEGCTIAMRCNRLVRTGRERPGGSRSTDKRKELRPLHLTPLQQRRRRARLSVTSTLDQFTAPQLEQMGRRQLGDNFSRSQQRLSASVGPSAADANVAPPRSVRPVPISAVSICSNVRRSSGSHWQAS
jgi:hypothetical protein